jgi:sugar lactone lactonase YvrE
MPRPLPRTAGAVLLVAPLLVASATPVAAADRGHRCADLPATYALSGDPAGSQFEGIDVGPDRRTFYVTETTGGEVHRGRIDDARTDVWLDEDAALADGRHTAVGIATDRSGRVYLAGGANRTAEGASADAPDFWVYDDDRELLAALRMPVDGPLFLNDVVVGPDGTAYVTDSITPRIFRVAREEGNWGATLWADAAATIPQEPGTFGLNGIEVAPDAESLLVAQTAAGRLWRFDLRTGTPTLVDTGSAVLTQSDGLVVRGRTLVAVRNQAHVLAHLGLADDATSASPLAEVGTDAERVLTTADVVCGRLLLVDSQFDEDPPSQDSEVVVLPFRP